ncbi:hypothetical protein G9A89_005691 [Geosiphon pyriformis]|nr:hypothetical protein G9A89_005691 [Geosiphon pyriformis]
MKSQSNILTNLSSSSSSLWESGRIIANDGIFHTILPEVLTPNDNLNSSSFSFNPSSVAIQESSSDKNTFYNQNQSFSLKYPAKQSSTPIVLSPQILPRKIKPESQTFYSLPREQKKSRHEDKMSMVDLGKGQFSWPSDAYNQFLTQKQTTKRRKLSVTKTATPHPYASKVPRPPNAFILYHQTKSKELAQIKSNNMNAATESVRHPSKTVAEMWREEPENVKLYYQREADVASVKHKKAHPFYKYKPQKKDNKSKANNHDKINDLSQPSKLNSKSKPKYCKSQVLDEHRKQASMESAFTVFDLEPLESNGQSSKQEPFSDFPNVSKDALSTTGAITANNIVNSDSNSTPSFLSKSVHTNNQFSTSSLQKFPQFSHNSMSSTPNQQLLNSSVPIEKLSDSNSFSQSPIELNNFPSLPIASNSILSPMQQSQNPPLQNFIMNQILEQSSSASYLNLSNGFHEFSNFRQEDQPPSQPLETSLITIVESFDFETLMCEAFSADTRNYQTALINDPIDPSWTFFNKMENNGQLSTPIVPSDIYSWSGSLEPILNPHPEQHTLEFSGQRIFQTRMTLEQLQAAELMQNTHLFEIVKHYENGYNLEYYHN